MNIWKQEKLIYCKFCDYNVYEETLMAIHFIREHRFNKKQNLSSCPLCSLHCLYIVDHMTECHPQHCVLCAEDIKYESQHFKCAALLEEAMQKYIDISIFV